MLSLIVYFSAHFSRFKFARNLHTVSFESHNFAYLISSNFSKYFHEIFGALFSNTCFWLTCMRLYNSQIILFNKASLTQTQLKVLGGSKARLDFKKQCMKRFFQKAENQSKTPRKFRKHSSTRGLLGYNLHFILKNTNTDEKYWWKNGIEIWLYVWRQKITLDCQRKPQHRKINEINELFQYLLGNS